MPRRERARLLLRGVAKLLAVVVAAGAVGIGVGVGLAALMGDDDVPPPAALGTGATTAATTPPATPATRSVPAATATGTTPRASPSSALAKVRVRVLGTVLHAASTPSGIRRQRARVVVRVRAENTGATAVTLGRPTLTAAGASVKTDSAADAPRTHFGPFAAGETQTVTLRFETAGRLTAQLTSERKGQLRIAGRKVPVFVTVGSPLRSSAQGDAGAATTTTPTNAATP